VLDIDQIRADTPGCKDVIHLNNAGSSLPPRPVVDAVVDYLRQEELAGGYETAAARVDELDDFYRATAEYLGCDTNEVAYCGSASEAWWKAFSSVRLVAGDRILVGHSEFQANAFGWLQAMDRGVIVDVVPNDERGDFDLAEFDRMFDTDVKLVSLTLISMSNGAVHPAAQLGDRLRDTDAIYLLDFCQGAGQMALNVDELGCDFGVYTGRKFMRGPRGTGALYARSSVLGSLQPSPFLDGRSATWSSQFSYEMADSALRFEFGEVSFASKVGLAVATRYALSWGMDNIENRVVSLAERFRAQLADVSGITVLDEGTRRCGIVTFSADSRQPLELQQSLRSNGVNLSAPGRVNAQLDMGDRGLDGVLRAGVHYFNTDEEIDRAVSLITGLI